MLRVRQKYWEKEKNWEGEKNEENRFIACSVVRYERSLRPDSERGLNLDSDW